MKRQATGRLADPLYLSAVLYWGLSRVFSLQVHKVLAVPLSADTRQRIELPPGYSFHAVRNIERLSALGPSIEEQLDEQSGLSCRAMLARGDRIYAIVESDRVACQVNIRRGPLTVDSPSDLAFDFRNGDLFLNYLHTREDYRGKGLATKLIRLACADAADQQAMRCFSHVRATNHASLAAFRRCGWEEVARILSTRSGRFIAAPGCAAAGMKVTKLSGAGSSA
ncbi:MAG TPA: GNAT family N-acetyltransferase [Burkholderiaceae bacterium]|nr:GNAT family N-acetyltransferase [Burkholderiaceae bacterium]